MCIRDRAGYSKLKELPGILVVQKLESSSMAGGCEVENSYSIYSIENRGKKLKDLGDKSFRASERSSIMQRLLGPCRPFLMRVDHANNEESNKHDTMDFLFMEKKFQCTLFCINRPFLSVYLNERPPAKNDEILPPIMGASGPLLGKIRSPFTLLDYALEVINDKDEVRYKIIGPCCQLARWLPCPCDACQRMHFIVYDATGTKELGRLDRLQPGCLKALTSTADNFALPYPEDATPEDRALLMAAVIFLDYRFFEGSVTKGMDLDMNDGTMIQLQLVFSQPDIYSRLLYAKPLYLFLLLCLCIGTHLATLICILLTFV
eukprot:TRINITY_DN13323_c0_g2_i2.p1 TRINITY_DN13323_c0_g2~~TRINITY_DN13323_c0_g2_i2.p1  ORF type:complete len:339 (-),score=40.71 TRINITY_DN13323_c0_g2_i2:89-1045(-)